MQSPEPTLVAALVKAASQVFTWLLVIVGWIVVSDQQYHRELIKARREKIEDVRKKLRELDDSARKFHNGIYDVSLMQAILRMTSGISMEISLLKSEGVIGMGTVDDMVSLRQAITSENFDEVNHTDKPADELLTRIDETYWSLDRQLATISTRMQAKRQTVFESLKDLSKRLY